MNRVGVEGRGESVWLAWFLIATLRAFARCTRSAGRRGRGGRASARQADAYAAAVETHGWDGEWYRRAYFDDGTPLGSAHERRVPDRFDRAELERDLGRGRSARAARRRCGRSSEHLVREDARILLLLTPPFDKTPHDPGYIKGYLPGVRENGAQYTHAALWAVLATAHQGNGDRAFELFQMINPLTARATPEEVGRVPARAVRRRGGRVHRGGARRPRRVDLVHRLGELDVPRRTRGDPRLHQAGRDAQPGSAGAGGVGGVRGRRTGMARASTRSWSSSRTAREAGIRR